MKNNNPKQKFIENIGRKFKTSQIIFYESEVNIIKKNQTKGEVLCNMLDWEKQV